MKAMKAKKLMLPSKCGIASGCRRGSVLALQAGGAFSLDIDNNVSSCKLNE